jgi:tripartite-type tricarboxylate transporter receptor subunit TctC
MPAHHTTQVIVAVIAGAFATGAAAQSPTPAAQSFPSRAVRLIMPLPAGSETDVFARTLGRQLGDVWGQQVVIENRPGGGTNIGAEVVAKAPADGYTLMHAITAHAINATLYTKLPFDPQKEFACVTQIGNLYGLLLTHPSVPVKNVMDLIRLAKARPGEITYATGGSGTSNHIAAEALRIAADINIQHVPYKGSNQAILDVLPGRIPVLATVLVEAVPYVHSGKLRAIASTSPKRAPSLPNVPTINESLPAYRAGVGFWAMVTRAGTPVATMNKLNGDIVKALQTPDVRARLAAADIEIVGSRPEQCDAFVREQTATWGAIVKASGARVD